ncbi:MAG: pilus assembly protein PilP [Pseudomonadota bacterium]
MRINQATRKLKATFFGTALILVLAGPAAISAAQEPPATAKPVTQAPQPLQEEAYRYNPEGRIDPFKPFADLEAAAKKKIDQSVALPRNPLQRLGLEQFRLVGVIEGNKGRRAMVQDVSGKFYSLVPGTYIGLNKGRVKAILKDSVIVLEKVSTEEGKIELRKQVMKLRQDEVKP